MGCRQAAHSLMPHTPSTTYCTVIIDIVTHDQLAVCFDGYLLLHNSDNANWLTLNALRKCGIHSREYTIQPSIKKPRNLVFFFCWTDP